MKHLLQKYFFLFILFSIISNGFSGEIKTPGPQNTVRFTENKNQWDKNILYRAELDGGVVFLEKNCFTYNFYDKEALLDNEHNLQENGYRNSKQLDPTNPRTHAFRMSFLNAETSTETFARQATPDFCNYFIGNDKSKWAGNVKNFKEVNYKNLYKHINLQILGLQNSIKCNFYVAPQGNTNDIQLLYEGLSKITLERGTLKYTTSINEIVEQHPYAYQWIGNKRMDVPCEFVLENTTVHFNFPNGYDKSYELVIDPVMIFAATSGSVSSNFGHTATYDEQGNLYSGGIAFGVSYPTTPGAYDTKFNGKDSLIVDVVITKYDASGTFLQYSTYLGGLSAEIVTSLIVDAEGNLFMYGVTGSKDFPVTSRALDKTFHGGVFYFPHGSNGNTFENGTDIFVAKLNATGSALLSSTYIGGSGNDGVNSNEKQNDGSIKLDSLQFNYGDYYRGAIELDPSGDVVIATATRSTDFPIKNGFDNSLNGKQDAIVFKLNKDLSKLIWSTYLGGDKNDCANYLVMDKAANVYVTGGTLGGNFPTTAGTLQTAYNGGKADGYITKIKYDGTAILASTLWGTPQYDQSYFVQLDKKNDVYLFGQSSGTMTATPGVYSNANSGQFITKMNNSLNTVIFSTVFGNGNGVPNISPTAFLVDDCENIYVSGWANAFNTLPKRPATNRMPITNDALDKITNDSADFYLMALTANASSLLYATYFGGGQSAEHVHGGTSRYDKKGVVYQSLCTGCGGYDDFPGTPGSWPNRPGDWNGTPKKIQGCNNGVFKLDFQVPLAHAAFSINKIEGCAPLTVTFHNQSTAGSTYTWDFGSNDITSTEATPVRTFDSAGTYTVNLYINDPSTCNVADTVQQIITVYPKYTADFDFAGQPCSKQYAFSDSSSATPVSWLWYFDDGDSSTVQNPIHTFNAIKKYDVQLISTSTNGCKDTAIVQVDNPIGSVSINSDVTICKNNSTQLSASGGTGYKWLPKSSLSNSTIANPIADPLKTTTYTVIISSSGGLGVFCKDTLTTTVKVIDPTLYSISATADIDTIVQGQSTTIHAITNPGLHVTWLASSGINPPPVFNPVVTPDGPSTYSVTILGEEGCAKSATVTIYVRTNECDPDDVFVPNTFTPNGDGKNDVLLVRGNEITELYFAVYNRWGQMVFETNDMTKGWNGVYKDMTTDPVVFAWYLKAKCFNGETIEKKGNVTLIR